MQIKFASKIDICEMHHVAIISKLAHAHDTTDLKGLVDLIKTVFQPHDNDYGVDVSNSGKAVIVYRTEKFAKELGVEQDFILITETTTHKEKKNEI